MKKTINILFIMGLMIASFACVSPEDPETSALISGRWTVNTIIVDREVEGLGGTDVTSLILERDGIFVYRAGGRAWTGEWEASEDTLTLNDVDGETIDFTIVSVNQQRMHLLRVLNSNLLDNVEIRYVFTRADFGGI
ncbi:MAG: lipocalin family protein [Cyclobacteriaceae bacterium]|nr:hypothetical protein [Cyclobacteriaceae bacterium]MCH8516751.1 lipocalin family protein [Cyclobacteriaceae bacterium]